MASDPKQSAPPETLAHLHREKGVRIFTYPKVVFIFPTMVIALICGIGMSLTGNDTSDPIQKAATARAANVDAGQPEDAQPAVAPKHLRFKSPANLFGVLFLGVFAFNLLIMAVDFPRFTIFGFALLILFAVFFILWLGAYFDVEIMRSVRVLMRSIFVVANAEFYYMVALVMSLIFVIIYITRYLDYWEVLPNEILHHHGPLSDLERFPTINVKFDKEIPDVFEFLPPFNAGRLVIHVSNERKAIVMDNVMHINSKEEALKRLLSRMEVRVTTDQEVAEP